MPGHRQMLPVPAVTGEVHYKTGLSQPLAEIVADFDFVFDNQEFHFVRTMNSRWG